jgi:probable HAF family extracellular repeat protein
VSGDLSFHPFLWERGEIKDLGTLGGLFGFANWISESGEVAGTADNEGGQSHAFLWKNGIMTDLGTVPGDSCSASQAVNSRGQMVGESSPTCDITTNRAFLWENGGPMVDLNTLVPSGSGLQLKGAADINDRGEIAGDGTPPGCFSVTVCGHAFLLIPCDEGHPNVEGCNYSLVDAAPAAQRPADASQSHPVPQALPQKPGTGRFGIRRP